MSCQNVLLKILLILTMGKSSVALGETVRHPANCFEQSGNLTAADKKGLGVTEEDKQEVKDVNHNEEEMEDEEDMFQLVDKRDIVVGFPNCLGIGKGKGQTMERQLGGKVGVMREGLGEKETDTDKKGEDMDEKETDTDEDMEDEEDTFQLVDKRSKTLIQPGQLCQQM